MMQQASVPFYCYLIVTATTVQFIYASPYVDPSYQTSIPVSTTQNLSVAVQPPQPDSKLPSIGYGGTSGPSLAPGVMASKKTSDTSVGINDIRQNPA